MNRGDIHHWHATEPAQFAKGSLGVEIPVVVARDWIVTSKYPDPPGVEGEEHVGVAVFDYGHGTRLARLFVKEPVLGSGRGAHDIQPVTPALGVTDLETLGRVLLAVAKRLRTPPKPRRVSPKQLDALRSLSLGNQSVWMFGSTTVATLTREKLADRVTGAVTQLQISEAGRACLARGGALE